MGLCWYCHWGWPRPIRDIYGAAVAALDGYDVALKFGPAHIVWEDENFDSAQWCLDHFDEYRGNWSESTLAVVRDSLVKLLEVPDEYKTEPAGFTEESHPADFPPPAHWEMGQ